MKSVGTCGEVLSINESCIATTSFISDDVNVRWAARLYLALVKYKRFSRYLMEYSKLLSVSREHFSLHVA